MRSLPVLVPVLALFGPLTVVAFEDSKAPVEKRWKEPKVLRFIPYREKSGFGKSKSQGECQLVDGFGLQKCKKGRDTTLITAKNCFSRCWCSHGNLNCDSFGTCNSEEMTKWCQCPGGENKDNDCIGFMNLCYCTPDNVFEPQGVWGDGRALARNRPDGGEVGLVTGPGSGAIGLVTGPNDDGDGGNRR